MTDFSKPTLSSTKTAFPGEIRDNVSAVAKMLYAGGESNIPVDTLRYNRTTKRFQTYNGSGWDDAELDNLINGAVSLAKMANIATDRLIGRDSTGSGVPEALTVGGGVEFSGAGGIQRAALTGAITAAAGSNVTSLSADAASRSSLLHTCGYVLTEGALSVVQMPKTSPGSASVLVKTVVPKGLKVTHLSAEMQSNKTAGTLALILYKNGSDSGQGITMANSSSLTWGSITSVSFSAGDSISIAISTDSSFDFVDSGFAQISCQAWGHFTE